MDNPLVSCLTATHGRFHVLCEAVSCFVEQDYENRELIILNNHHVPLRCDLPKVRIVNEPGHPTLGDCRNRLLMEAKGGFVRTWDDDDLYLPWAISQGIENIGTAAAFKPHASWDSRQNEIYNLGDNVYEAAMTVRIDVAREYGYRHAGGDEHEPLLKGIEISGGCRRAKVRPSYCYRWASGLHRISGTLGSGKIEDRTAEWKKQNDDTGGGIPISKISLEQYWKDIEVAEKTVAEKWPQFVWQETKGA